MARLLSQTLVRYATTSSSHTIKATVVLPPFINHARRHRSSEATKPQFIEIDLASSSSSPAATMAGGEQELILKEFEDFIQRILVKKATPDWLPFSPGSSFWVPPRPIHEKFVNLVDILANELSDEECLSLASLRGGPCSNFFIKENINVHLGDADVGINGPEEMEVRVEVKVLTSENVAHSEDEEG